MHPHHPQALKDPAVLEERRNLLSTATHLEALEQWRTEYEATFSRPIPHFDPGDAGTEARVLWLLEKPPSALLEEGGSGIVSVDNPDASAERCWIERSEANLRDGVLVWNLIPYSVDVPKSEDKAAGTRALRKVLRLLPRLEVVILCTQSVQTAWMNNSLSDAAPRATLVKAPGIGPMAGQSRQREELRKAVHRAKRLVG